MYPVKHIEKGGSKLHNFISIYNYLIILKLPVSPIKQASSVCVIYMFYQYCEISMFVFCINEFIVAYQLSRISALFIASTRLRKDRNKSGR